MKLGAVISPRDDRDLKAASYFDAERLARVDLPSSWGYDAQNSYGVDQWAMLGNDEYGDCVWAGAAHEHMLWNRAAGRPVVFSTESVLSDYSAVTGFNPDDPESDQGTDVRTALKYRVSTGIADENGERHKLGAYLAVDVSNLRELLVSSYLFEAVALCWNLPESAQQQFSARKMWSYVDGSPIEGGHYTCLNAKRRHLETVTWARSVPFDSAFMENYLSAAWALMSPEALEGSGVTPLGLDLATLKADLAQVAEL